MLAALGRCSPGVPSDHGAARAAQPSGLAFGLLLVAGLVNLALGLGLLQVGRRTRSLTLIADGKHVLTDVWSTRSECSEDFSSSSRLVSTGWTEPQPASWPSSFWWRGAQLLRHSIAGLMDAADPELLSEIVRLVSEHRRENWIDIHRLRAWRSGNRLFLDFHLILPRDLVLSEVHREVKELEEIFQNHFQGLADILIHVDPCQEPVCPVCGHDPCQLRQGETHRQLLWRREALTAEEPTETEPQAPSPDSKT